MDPNPHTPHTLILNLILSPNPKQVILRAPMTSICGILCPSRLCCCCPTEVHKSCCSCFGNRSIAGSCDAVRNIDLIGDVRVPVFFLHSKDDEIIPWQHTELLAEHTRTETSIWWMVRPGEQGYRHPEAPLYQGSLHPEFSARFADFLVKCCGSTKQEGTCSLSVGEVSLKGLDHQSAEEGDGGRMRTPVASAAGMCSDDLNGAPDERTGLLSHP